MRRTSAPPAAAVQKQHPSADQHMQLEQGSMIRWPVPCGLEQRGDSLLTSLIRADEPTLIEAQTVAPATIQAAARQRPYQLFIACPELTFTAHIHTVHR